MEAPKPLTPRIINIKKDLKSEQGNNFFLFISYKIDKFIILLEKKDNTFDEKYKNEYTINQLHENNYLKLFSSPKEILEELNDRIDFKTPILTENKDNINLIIFIPISKFKQIEFNLTKENNDKIIEKSSNIKLMIDKLYETIEELKKENKMILEENKLLKEKNKKIEIRLERIENKLRLNKNKSMQSLFDKKNLHWINKEVNIVNSSDFYEEYPPEIMLGKKNNFEYALTVGNKNHFVEFSFIKTYFLKAIRILVHSLECSLKTFSIELILQNGERNNIGTFIRSKYSEIKDFQEFEINKECKGIKLFLIDNWGKQGGNYILISKIDFNVRE